MFTEPNSEQRQPAPADPIPYIAYLRYAYTLASKPNSKIFYAYDHVEMFAMLFETDTPKPLLDDRIGQALLIHGAARPASKSAARFESASFDNRICGGIALDMRPTDMNVLYFQDKTSALSTIRMLALKAEPDIKRLCNPLGLLRIDERHGSSPGHQLAQAFDILYAQHEALHLGESIQEPDRSDDHQTRPPRPSL